MSIVFTTTIDINAPRSAVWGVLTDFPRYGAWSNFTSIDGVAQMGAPLSMRMPGFSFRSVVTVVRPDAELEWAAKIFSPRIFYGQHNFTLSTNADGSTHVSNTETFSGGLVRPLGGLFKPGKGGEAKGYAAFNQALKARVEALPAG